MRLKTKLFATGVRENSRKYLPALYIEDKSLSDEAVDHRSELLIFCFRTVSSFYLPYGDSFGFGKPSSLPSNRMGRVTSRVTFMIIYAKVTTSQTLCCHRPEKL